MSLQKGARKATAPMGTVILRANLDITPKSGVLGNKARAFFLENGGLTALKPGVVGPMESAAPG